MKKSFKKISVGLLMLLMIAGPAAAAQFAAEMMIKDGDRFVPAKIYVQDGKMRQEFNDQAGQTITIVRPDMKVVWIILPQERAYAELPLGRKLPGQFIQIPADALSKRLVGKETVNGYESERYEVTVRGGRGLEKQTIWLVPKLETPVKMLCNERKFCVEYRSIKEVIQADRLFNLPPGYKKLEATNFSSRLDSPY